MHNDSTGKRAGTTTGNGNKATGTGKPGRFGPASFPDVRWPDPLFVPPPWEGGTGEAINERRRDKPAPTGASRS